MYTYIDGAIFRKEKRVCVPSQNLYVVSYPRTDDRPGHCAGGTEDRADTQVGNERRSVRRHQHVLHSRVKKKNVRERGERVRVRQSKEIESHICKYTINISKYLGLEVPVEHPAPMHVLERPGYTTAYLERSPLGETPGPPAAHERSERPAVHHGNHYVKVTRRMGRTPRQRPL